MRRTLLRACGVVVLGAFGFGTAYALAGSGAAAAALPTTSVTLPTVTTPTVTVPPLPTTTTVTVPPLPTTTTVTLPPPPTTTTVTVPPLPTTTTVTPPPPPPPPPTSTPTLPQPSLPATQPANVPSSPSVNPSTTLAVPGTATTVDERGSSGASEPSASSTRSPEAGHRSAPARLERFDVSRDRFVNRGKDRGATVIRFRLARAAELVLVVRGPGPSCATVARIALRGRAGPNRIRFDGRIAGRPLEAGTYLLTPRLRGRTADLGHAFVTIVDPDAPAADRVLPQCAEHATLASSFLGGEEGRGGSRPAQPGSVSAAALDWIPARRGIRGEESPFLRDLPWPHAGVPEHRLPADLRLAVIALLIVSLLGTLLVEVVRQRRSQQA